jgi:GT2 family glycosyltransferase
MITAVIVNYFTAKFLPALLHLLEDEPLISSVIVADNSQETGLKQVTDRFNKARLLIFEENIGYGAAINRAAALTSGEFILVLNPDVVPLPGSIAALLKGAMQIGALVSGPRFFWDDMGIFRLPPATGYCQWYRSGDQAAASCKLDTGLFSFNTAVLFERFWKETEPFPEPFLTGAALLIRMDEEIFPGRIMFDEQFFMYYEDTDLCARLVLSGRVPVCVPSATFVHYWDQSPSEKKTEMMVASERLFYHKYYGTDPPLWDVSRYIPDNVEDMGSLTVPPEFIKPRMAEGKILAFDFGVNHYFRPFVRAIFDDGVFSFPHPVWENLRPGNYWSRIFDCRFYQTYHIYKWNKL